MSIKKISKNLNYFFADELFLDKINLSKEESLHIAKVMRYKKGDFIKLFDTKGNIAHAEISSVSLRKNQVSCIILKIQKQKQKSPFIHLYISPPKNKIYIHLLRQITTMGVYRIIPIKCQYSIRLETLKRENIKKNFIVASKQSHNFFPPILENTLTFSQALQEATGQIFYGHCQREKSKQLPQIKEKIISLFIGPEGGFSPQEKEKLKKKALPISIGSYIMKIETACIALLAKILPPN